MKAPYDLVTINGREAKLITPEPTGYWWVTFTGSNQIRLVNERDMA